MEVASFASLSHVVSLVSCAKHGVAIQGALDAALRHHAEAFAQAYGDDPASYIPKFHFTRHLPRQLDAGRWLADTFVTERFHGLAKEAANPVTKYKCFFLKKSVFVARTCFATSQSTKTPT